MNIRSSTQPNAIPEGRAASIVAAPAIAPTQLFYWSLRREFWENRSLYLAPLITGALILFGMCLNFLRFHVAMHSGFPDREHRHDAFAPFDFAAGAIMAVVMVVAFFYSLDALYGERRDRSILFWKSLPVSDLITVLAKASIPVFIVQFIGFACLVATQTAMVLLSVVLGPVTGAGSALWTHEPLLVSWPGLLYHLFTVHVLWHAPLYCWLLLVSAWARRAPVLWATLPPLVVAAVEKIAFNTHLFLDVLGYRLTGPEESVFPSQGYDPMSHPSMVHSGLAHFMSDPGLWRGLIVAAILIAITVRIRRYRDPV